MGEPFGDAYGLIVQTIIEYYQQLLPTIVNENVDTLVILNTLITLKKPILFLKAKIGRVTRKMYFTTSFNAM